MSRSAPPAEPVEPPALPRELRRFVEQLEEVSASNQKVDPALASQAANLLSQTRDDSPEQTLLSCLSTGKAVDLNKVRECLKTYHAAAP